MNITLTGARGFVGGATCRRLAEKGHVVTGLARPEWDLLGPDAWQAVPSDTEILIHTAAAFEGQSSKDVLWKTNVVALMGLVRRSRELSRLRQIIFCSSGAVYLPQRGPVTVDTGARPQTAYGMSKLLGETMLQHGCAVPVTSIRLFFPFGPGQKLPRLVPRLVNAIRNGEPVLLDDASGAPRLNPLPVPRAAAFLAARASELPDSSRVFNLGGPVTLSMKQLAEKIGQRVGRPPMFRLKNAPVYGCLHCEPGEASGTTQEFEDTLTAAVESLS